MPAHYRIALPFLLACAPAQAATFLVDTTDDSGAVALQVCDADPSNANCSLRGALAKADSTAGAHTIMFNVPISDAGYIAATSHWRFAPATELRYSTRDLTVDGYSQPGATANTNAPADGGSNAVLKIEIRGPGISAQSTALRALDSGSSLTLRGLAVNRFQVNVALDAVGAHRIEGCFIGTDITGTIAAETSNGSGTGIRSGGPAIIGGSDAPSRNVISGNPSVGISNNNGAALTVKGNLIGTNAAGTAALPGQDYGLYLTVIGNGGIVGGAAPADRNVIAGNTFSAIYAFGQVAGANPMPLRVLGNFIGTGADGVLPLGNGTNPQSPSQPQPTIVSFAGAACGIVVGGDASGEGNLIAHGGAAGVLVSSCLGARIAGNRFTLNRGIGIDLSNSSNADGATANDAGDADGNAPFQGGNRLQNFPELIGLTCAAGTCALTYRVDTDVANATYPLRIDVARGRQGQAETPVAFDTYTSIDAGLPKTVTFPIEALAGGGSLVLGATDAAGNTSEFGGEHLFSTGFD
jgi:parallel beta-helix repeat protein